METALLLMILFAIVVSYSLLSNEIKLLKHCIMGTLADIKVDFEKLKTAIAEERAQATAKLAELQQSIDDLTANLSGGGTVEERDALIADINTQIAEVKAIIPDAPVEPA